MVNKDFSWLNKLSTEKLLEIGNLLPITAPGHLAIARILKDRLEGLDDVVRVEALNDKVVDA